MNVFVIPSWYPSDVYPHTGIFFKEQAVLLARQRQDWQVGISLWGSHNPLLWVRPGRPLDALIKLTSRFPVKPSEGLLEGNCVEFFHPAHTWTRKWRGGNIRGIIAANVKNYEQFRLYYGKPDVIHAHASFPGGFIAMHLAERYRIPYVVTEHMSPFPMNSFRRDFKKYLIPPLKKADMVLAVSRTLQERLGEFGVNARQASNYIDEAFFTPKPASNPVFTFLNVGRLTTQKGHRDLLKAAGMLKQKEVSFVLKIAGSGELSAFLKKTARRLGLEGEVEWLGELSRDGVLAAMRQADAFVLSSLHENQPVAVLEALACGKPVVTTSAAGELISDQVGFVVPAGHPEELAGAMQQMTTAPFSPEAIRRYFEEHFGLEKCIGRLEQYYSEIL